MKRSRVSSKVVKKAPSRPDLAVFFLTASLLVFGWVVLYSASALVAESRFGDQYYYLKKQMIWSGIGLAGLLIFSRINLKIVQRSARLIYVGMVVLLGLVLLVGHEVGGAKRWLRVAGLGIQPSEFAKLSIVLLLADFLDRKRSKLSEFWSGFVPPMALVGIVLGLIALERDLGTPLLISLVSVGMIFLAGARYLHLIGIALAALPLLYFALFHVAYRRQRLFAFLDPWKDARGTGYQLVQSLLALGSGGFWGRGSGESTIKMYYLPESQTDFVFSIFGEEFGF
ncbi:MAG: FtsW/RodA/SpoVE family cell cycle protein, partial [Elusimicrobia bacterium]|nr:FtsW/RodA/SpoVE family cell cycle protein [Elusimicrobiota bacterium]